MTTATIQDIANRVLARRVRADIDAYRAQHPDDYRPTQELVRAWLADRIREGQIERRGDRYIGKLD
jgi:hypothetical protein